MMVLTIDSDNNEKGWVIEWGKEYNKNAIYKFIFDYTNYIKDYE